MASVVSALAIIAVMIIFLVSVMERKYLVKSGEMDSAIRLQLADACKLITCSHVHRQHMG